MGGVPLERPEGVPIRPCVVALPLVSPAHQRPGISTWLPKFRENGTFSLAKERVANVELA